MKHKDEDMFKLMIGASIGLGWLAFKVFGHKPDTQPNIETLDAYLR